MRPAWNGFDDGPFAAPNHDVVRFTGFDLSETKAGSPPNDHEFFGLTVMIVLAASNPRMGGKIRELAIIRSLQYFRKAAAWIAIFRHLVGKRSRRKVTNIGCIK